MERWERWNPFSYKMHPVLVYTMSMPLSETIRGVSRGRKILWLKCCSMSKEYMSKNDPGLKVFALSKWPKFEKKLIRSLMKWREKIWGFWACRTMWRRPPCFEKRLLKFENVLRMVKQTLPSKIFSKGRSQLLQKLSLNYWKCKEGLRCLCRRRKEKCL